MQILYVDFETEKLIKTVEIEKETEIENDPVLAGVQKKLSPEMFDIYKKTIENYLEESFILQMKERNGIMYLGE